MVKDLPTTEITKLKETISKLKAQVRNLRKRLKSKEYEVDSLKGVLTDEDIKDIKEEKKTKTCLKCGSKSVRVTNIGVWELRECEYCGDKTKEMKD